MSEGWQIIDLQDALQGQPDTPVSYTELLNTKSMHCGVYRLAAGSKDMQTPHDEDEVYYVLSGRAQLRVGDEQHEVRPGMLLFVRATEDHAFFEIKEDITLLVIFA